MGYWQRLRVIRSPMSPGRRPLPLSNSVIESEADSKNGVTWRNCTKGSSDGVQWRAGVGSDTRFIFAASSAFGRYCCEAIVTYRAKAPACSHQGRWAIKLEWNHSIAMEFWGQTPSSSRQKTLIQFRIQ